MALYGTDVMAERLTGLERTMEQINARLARLHNERSGRIPSSLLSGLKAAVQWKWFSMKHPWPSPGRPVRENKRLVTYDRA